MTLEQEVENRVATLVSLLQARKSRLIEAARQTREARVRSLRDQVARCATHLQATTALLTFCIEALKETDSAAFLQIGGMLSVRAATAAGSWGGAEGVQEIARLPLLDLTLDDKPLRRAIDQLTFVQHKRKYRGSTPRLTAINVIYAACVGIINGAYIYIKRARTGRFLRACSVRSRAAFRATLVHKFTIGPVLWISRFSNYVSRRETTG